MVAQAIPIQSLIEPGQEKPRLVQDRVDPVPGAAKAGSGESCPLNFTFVKTGWVGRKEKWLPHFAGCFGSCRNKTEFGLSISHFMLLDINPYLYPAVRIRLLIFSI